MKDSCILYVEEQGELTWQVGQISLQVLPLIVLSWPLYNTVKPTYICQTETPALYQHNLAFKHILQKNNISIVIWNFMQSEK